MAECDANYARLRALAPVLCSPGLPQADAAPQAKSSDTGAHDEFGNGSQDYRLLRATERFSIELGESNVRVVIEVVECSRYTTLLRFTQEAVGIAQQFAPPTMAVRLYHDARSAEVVEVRNENRFKEVYEYPNPKMRARDEKVQVNRFLGEYLSICLRYGLAESVELAVDTLR